MSKSALEKIESHEKLCRIMQKQTHDRIEKILIACAGGLLAGMGFIIFELLTRI